jgi:hypothetical protein
MIVAGPHKLNHARQAGIQYAAAYRLNPCRLWNTGSSAFADDDTEQVAG